MTTPLQAGPTSATAGGECKRKIKAMTTGRQPTRHQPDADGDTAAFAVLAFGVLAFTVLAFAVLSGHADDGAAHRGLIHARPGYSLMIASTTLPLP
jgi:hypothetical protein